MKNTARPLLISFCSIDIIEMISGGNFVSRKIFVRVVDMGKSAFALNILKVFVGRNLGSVRLFIRFNSAMEQSHEVLLHSQANDRFSERLERHSLKLVLLKKMSVSCSEMRK